MWLHRFLVLATLLLSSIASCDQKKHSEINQTAADKEMSGDIRHVDGRVE
jgi:hypothetical protein